MRNPVIPKIANRFRGLGFDVFDDWFSPGELADEKWKSYENLRGRSYIEALQGHHARHVFEFDKFHIDQSDIGILILPAGRSGHLELGYMKGKGKHCFILLEPESERFDIMYKFADAVFANIEDLEIELIKLIN